MISIIIPTLNEEKALSATLQHVFDQNGKYEVILVDGGSKDRTLAVARQFPEVSIIIAKRGRASQMNAGAKSAKGECLLFLHADALLPPNALPTILQQEADAGGFRHRFSGNSRGLKLVSWLHNFRCSRTGVFYGDQAMFVRQSLFAQLGGFPDVPALEDLLFGELLVSATNPVFLELEVISDSRKFEQQGVWLSLFRVILIQLCHELQLPAPTRKFFTRIR